MSGVIQTPDIPFSGNYYPERLLDLLRWKRRNLPELTSEHPYDPTVQLLRAFAMMGHYDSVRLDAMALEAVFGTCRTRRSLGGHLDLIARPLRSDVPSTTEIVAKLTQVFVALTEVIPEEAVFSTRAQGSDASIPFQVDEAVSVQGADQIDGAFIFDESLGVYTPVTFQVNNAGFPFSPFPGVPAVGDMFYFGHESVLFDRGSITGISAAGSDIEFGLEFYDGSWKDTNPGTVADLGGTIRFRINTLLGPNDRSGAVVRVYLNETDVYEELVSTYAGGENFITTTGTLGQVLVSTDPTDYTIGAEWRPIESTDNFPTGSTEGSVSWVLPKEQGSNWIKGSVNGQEAYWMRLRVISLGGVPVLPVWDVLSISAGGQYVEVAATQGRVVSDPDSTGTGLPDQVIKTARKEVVDDSTVVLIDGAEWVEVDNLLASGPLDKHYYTRWDVDEYTEIRFGDGITGAIPGAGSVRSVSYRVDATEDGNVGSGTIIQNTSGISYLTAIRNFIPAAGWQRKEGYDQADIARMKVLGPASLRALTASAPMDYETRAINWTDTDTGATPVVRAKAIEEVYGLKTIQLVTVGAGGAYLSGTMRSALDRYFNDDDDGVGVANSEVTTDNYIQKVIAVTVQVWGLTPGNEYKVQSQLAAFLDPLAQDSEGNWIWAFGGTVSHSRIESEVYKADSTITDVLVSIPAGNIALGSRELPVAGVIGVVIM